MKNVETTPAQIELTIDERRVRVAPGTTLWEAARGEELAPVGVCRICVVEIEGERVLAASCVREAQPGMVIRTGGPKIDSCRKVLAELLVSEQPDESKRQSTTGDDELIALSRTLASASRLPRGEARPDDDSSPVMSRWYWI